MFQVIFKQPNGLYGRVSSVVDAPTHVDMTEKDLHDHLMETMSFNFLGQSVKEWLERYERSVDEAVDMVNENNMTAEEIEEWKNKIGYEATTQ